jgi:hypothetical protein
VRPEASSTIGWNTGWNSLPSMIAVDASLDLLESGAFAEHRAEQCPATTPNSRAVLSRSATTDSDGCPHEPSEITPSVPSFQISGALTTHAISGPKMPSFRRGVRSLRLDPRAHAGALVQLLGSFGREDAGESPRDLLHVRGAQEDGLLARHEGDHDRAVDPVDRQGLMADVGSGLFGRRGDLQARKGAENGLTTAKLLLQQGQGSALGRHRPAFVARQKHLSTEREGRDDARSDLESLGVRSVEGQRMSIATQTAAAIGGSASATIWGA